MNLEIHLSYPHKPVVVYWQDELLKFHHILAHEGKKWSWVSYDSESPITTVNYRLYYSELSSLDPDYYEPCPKLDDLVNGNSWGKKDCECGAAFSSFPFDHMKYCPLHKPWGSK